MTKMKSAKVSTIRCSWKACGLALLAAGTIASPCRAELPDGTWSAEKVEEILERTLVVRLEPDLSALTPAERDTVEDLLAAGKILHRVYLESKHSEGLRARTELESRHGQALASQADPART